MFFFDGEGQGDLKMVPNVPSVFVVPIFIRIKHKDEEVYRKYTGRNNKLVIENLQAIAERKKQDRCVIRLPMIPGYNNESKRESGHALLRTLGFSRFDFFTYQTDK